MEEEIDFPRKNYYKEKLIEKEKTLIKIIKKSLDLKELSLAKKGFEMMFDYFLEYPTSSLKDFDIYLKTKMREDYSWTKELGAQEFIKELYNLREKNFIFQNKEDLNYLD